MASVSVVNEIQIKKKAKDDDKPARVINNAVDLQRLKVEKLMSNPTKQAFIPEKSKEKAPRGPLEFIRNIWGSSAGAGSGDFHVYRGVRRREYARQKFIGEQAEKEELDNAFKEKIEKNKREAEERMAKNRAKRLKKKEKQKANKKKKGNSGAAKQTTEESSDDDEGDSAEAGETSAVGDSTSVAGDQGRRTEDSSYKRKAEDSS